MIEKYFKQFPLTKEDVNHFLSECNPQLFKMWQALSKSEQDNVVRFIETSHFDKFTIKKTKNGLLKDEHIVLLSKPFIKDIEDVLMQQYHSQMSEVRAEYVKWSDKRDLSIDVNNSSLELMEKFCRAVMALKQSYKEMFFRQVSVDSFLFSLFDLEGNFVRNQALNYKGVKGFSKNDYEQLVKEVKSKNNMVDVFTFLDDFSKNEADGFRYIGSLPNGMPHFIDIYIALNYCNQNAKGDLKIIEKSVLRKSDFSQIMNEKFISEDGDIYYNCIFKFYYNLLSNQHFNEEKSEVDVNLEKKYKHFIASYNIDNIKRLFKPLYFYNRNSNIVPLRDIVSEEAIVYGFLIRNEAIKTLDVSFIKQVEKDMLKEDEITVLKGFKDTIKLFDKNGDLEKIEKQVIENEDNVYLESVYKLRDFIKVDDKNFLIKINAEKVNIMQYLYNEVFIKEMKDFDLYSNDVYFNIKLKNTDTIKIKKYRDAFNNSLKNVDSGMELNFLNISEEDLYNQLNNNKSLWLSIEVLFNKEFNDDDKKRYFKIVASHIQNSIGIIYSTCKLNKEYLEDMIETEIQFQNMKNDILPTKNIRARTNKF